MEMIKVDKKKCTRCGACAEVCPVGCIAMGEDGPREAAGKHCIACGHCVAVCPTEAMDNENAPLEKQVPASPVLDANTAGQFLRARRSIRRYKPDAVPREKILELLDIARLAPTGSNAQRVSYMVYDEADTLRGMTAATIDWMEEQIRQGSAWARYFAGTVATYRKTGEDVILRDAPCLVAAMAAKSFLPRGRDNTHFALAYAELYAPTLGLGTCWTGLLESCAVSGYKPLADLLRLPEGQVFTGGLMVGFPKYRYQRLVDRNPLQVSWAADLT
jgi:nitroreductase/NAD-dependent dihydropyrimidine dehydrogenase PreA subunit